MGGRTIGDGHAFYPGIARQQGSWLWSDKGEALHKGATQCLRFQIASSAKCILVSSPKHSYFQIFTILSVAAPRAVQIFWRPDRQGVVGKGKPDGNYGRQGGNRNHAQKLMLLQTIMSSQAYLMVLDDILELAESPEYVSQQVSVFILWPMTISPYAHQLL